MPLWALAVVLVFAGAAIGVAAVLALTGDGGGRVTVAEEARTTSFTTSSTASSTSSSTTTTTETPTTTTTAVPVTTAPTTTAAPDPRGSLRLLDFYGGARVEPSCQQWDVLVVNNSNVEVVELRFEYERYVYSSLDDYDPQTQQYPPDQPAEYPGPTKQPVSIPPGVEQAISTVTCTPTPVPTNADGYELNTSRPVITWVWQGGRTGSLRF